MVLKVWSLEHHLGAFSKFSNRTSQPLNQHFWGWAQQHIVTVLQWCECTLKSKNQRYVILSSLQKLARARNKDFSHGNVGQYHIPCLQMSAAKALLGLNFYITCDAFIGWKLKALHWESQLRAAAAVLVKVPSKREVTGRRQALWSKCWPLLSGLWNEGMNIRERKEGKPVFMPGNALQVCCTSRWNLFSYLERSAFLLRERASVYYAKCWKETSLIMSGSGRLTKHTAAWLNRVIWRGTYEGALLDKGFHWTPQKQLLLI